MIKPEIAQEQLEKARSEKFVSQRLARLAKLPKPLREDVRSLFERSERGHDADWLQRHQARQKAIAAFGAMPQSAQMSLIEAAFRN